MKKEICVMIDSALDGNTAVRDNIIWKIAKNLEEKKNCCGEISCEEDWNLDNNKNIQYSWVVGKDFKKPTLIISQDLDTWENNNIDFEYYISDEKITIEPEKL